MTGVRHETLRCIGANGVVLVADAYGDPGAEPVLLLHGDADKTVPLQQSVNFQKRVRAVGGTCDLMTISGAPHALIPWAKIDPGYQAAMLAWLARTLGPALAR